MYRLALVAATAAAASVWPQPASLTSGNESLVVGGCDGAPFRFTTNAPNSTVLSAAFARVLSHQWAAPPAHFAASSGWTLGAQLFFIEEQKCEIASRDARPSASGKHASSPPHSASVCDEHNLASPKARAHL